MHLLGWTQHLSLCYLCDLSQCELGMGKVATMGAEALPQKE